MVLYHMEHTIYTISYEPYNMVHIVWSPHYNIYLPLDINKWNDANVEMYMESGFMNIATAQFEDEDELNCKVVSPARIMQWILSGK